MQQQTGHRTSCLVDLSHRHCTKRTASGSHGEARSAMPLNIEYYWLTSGQAGLPNESMLDAADLHGWILVDGGQNPLTVRYDHKERPWLVLTSTRMKTQTKSKISKR